LADVSVDERSVIFERLFSRLLMEAEMLLLHGAMPEELDDAMLAFGFEVGPLELQDRIGTDVEYARRKARKILGQWPEDYLTVISDRMVEEGRLGRQTVVGWYRYPGGKGKVEDPLIEDLVAEESHFAGVNRRQISKPEIQTVLVCAIADEALAIVDESVGQPANKVDEISTGMLGFPNSQGGILAFTRQKGAGFLAEQFGAIANRFRWLQPVDHLNSVSETRSD
jgi:3-hydroxyacyl-CoA dehydrogenase